MQRHSAGVVIVLGAVCLLISVLATSGCGSGGKSGADVTGSVALGGQAQDGVRVTFIPMAAKGDVPPQGGATQADGKFKFKIVPGKYKVTLTKWVDKDGKVPGESEDPTKDFTQMMESGLLKQVFPGQYADPSSTPIEVDVPAGGKDLEPFVVDK
jgi:hypothetical protein